MMTKVKKIVIEENMNLFGNKMRMQGLLLHYC